MGLSRKNFARIVAMKVELAMATSSIWRANVVENE